MKRTFLLLLALALTACASPTEPTQRDWCVWHGTGPTGCAPLPQYPSSR